MIRDSVTLFGMVTTPRWICHLQAPQTVIIRADNDQDTFCVPSPQDDLSGGLLVSLSQPKNHGLLEENRLIRVLPRSVWGAQRAVGGHHKSPVPTVAEELHLRQVGVALDLDAKVESDLLAVTLSTTARRLTGVRSRRHLQHGGFDAGHGENLVHLAAVEVGQTDGPDQAFLHQLLHRGPRELVIDVVVQQRAVLLFREWDISATGRKDRKKREPQRRRACDYSGLALSSLEGVGPVDEVEVQVLQLEVLQGVQQGRLHVLWVVLGVPQFGCDEHVFSLYGLV